MINRIFASLLAALFLVGALGAVAGCNTIAGVGTDVEKGGRAIKNEANEKR